MIIFKDRFFESLNRFAITDVMFFEEQCDDLKPKEMKQFKKWIYRFKMRQYILQLFQRDTAIKELKREVYNLGWYLGVEKTNCPEILRKYQKGHKLLLEIEDYKKNGL